MHKSLIGLAAATAVGLATLAGPGTANAGCYGCAVGAGIIGGVAAGAIIGSAIANSPPPPPPGYYPPPPAAYYPPPGPAAGPGYGPGYAQLAPGCYWGKRQVWVEGYGYQLADRANLPVTAISFDSSDRAPVVPIELIGALLFCPGRKFIRRLRRPCFAMRSCR